MLKGIDPLLSPDLLRVLRAMGHGDEIAIVDGNYPAEEHGKRVVRLDGHGAPRILEAILSVMPVDDMVPEAVWRPAAHMDPQRMEPVFEDFAAVLLKHEPKQKDRAAGGRRLLQQGQGVFRHRRVGRATAVWQHHRQEGRDLPHVTLAGVASSAHEQRSAKPKQTAPAIGLPAR